MSVFTQPLKKQIKLQFSFIFNYQSNLDLHELLFFFLTTAWKYGELEYKNLSTKCLLLFFSVA